MKLCAFLMSLWDEGVKLRKGGVSVEDIRRGLHTSLLEYVREHNLAMDERDLPHWQMVQCPVCQDSHWRPTTRMVRGQPVEAYRPCECTARPTEQPDYRARAAEKVAGGWK